MSLTNCNFRCSCTLFALVAGIILGIITAFVQITGVITATPVFLWVSLGIAVLSLWTLAVAVALVRRYAEAANCCSAMTGLLAGILGTILLSAILLAFGIVATSVISAILVGLLVFFLTLTFVGTACFIRCLSNCSNT